jgi:gag-polyprotein putative aspartyl protease
MRLTRLTSRTPSRLERWALETRRFVPDAKSKKYLRFLALALLLSLPFRNVAHPDVIHLPFRTVQSMILVQGKVNGKPITFLLDTGATRTIVSARAYGYVGYRLRLMQRVGQQPGFVGESVSLPVNLELERHTWLARRVSVMNFDGLNGDLGADFDGLLGEDVLREFRSVHIDYRNHQIDLEQ